MKGNGMNTPPTALAQLETLLVSGADADGFLQGQLSLDIGPVGPESVGLAACNSAQGRVQAVVWLTRRSDGIALVVARSMAPQLVTRLRKYVLRSRVTIQAVAGGLQVALLP